MPDSRLRAYENGVAEANAAKKQIDAIRNLQSSNKLAKYGPFWCLYAIIVFVLWCIGWFFNIDKYGCVFSQSLLNVIGATNGSNGVCVESITKPVFDDISFRTFSFFSSGTFAASFITQLIQLTDSDIKNSIRAAPVYCTAVVNLISFMCHLSMALGWSPVVVSPFGRVTHVARWGAWVSLVPLMMVMMHAIDLKTEDDVRYMWLSTALQQVSVLTGGVASMTPNVTVAVVMLTFSFASYAFIFYDTWRALRRKGEFLKTIQESEVETENKTRFGQSIRVSSKPELWQRLSGLMSDGKGVEGEVALENIQEMVQSIEYTSLNMSIRLTIACAVSWTLIVLVYTLGMFNLISCETECIWQSAMDILAKCVYQQALCTSHGTSLSPEGILSRMLLLEEQANASIRQFLRFICHEVYSPLNAVMISLNHVEHTLKTEMPAIYGDEYIPEIISLSQSCCKEISDTLSTVIQLNESSAVDQGDPQSSFNLRKFISEIATPHIRTAEARDISIVLAIDPRIPDTMLGPTYELKQIIGMLIRIGVELTDQGKTCTIVGEHLGSRPLSASTASTSQDSWIRISIRDSGLTMENLGTDISTRLDIVRRLVLRIGGKMSVERTTSARVISFDFQYSVPQFRSIVIDRQSLLLNAEILTSYQETDEEEVSNSIDKTNSDYSGIDDNLYPVRNSNSSMPSMTSNTSSLDGNGNNPSMAYTPTNNKSNPNTMSYTYSNNRSMKGTSLDTRTSTIHTLGKKVLIVDDVGSNRKLLANILSRYGLEADTAEDGLQLLEKVIDPQSNQVNQKYDMIIVDNIMPRMTGRDAVERLRKHSYNGIIIGLTGSTLDSDMSLFERAGCNFVLPKPLKWNDLKTRLAKIGYEIEGSHINK